MAKQRPTVEQIMKGIRQGDVLMLSRAITLAESSVDSDKQIIYKVLEDLYSPKINSLRIAISGAPGVGKSTLIEALGQQFINAGKKVAVLTIDPSSKFSGGSILGDKTRMEKLSKSSKAFIRPSSAGSTLGGVGSATREAVLLCELAGYEIVIVETVGVGQSEIEAAEFCDLFCLVLVPGMGDELQEIKRGIMEVPDLIIVNKSDAEYSKKCSELAKSVKAFLHQSKKSSVPVFELSAIENRGIQELLRYLLGFKHEKVHIEKRIKGNLTWFESRLKYLLWKRFTENTEVQQEIKEYKQIVQGGNMLPPIAADKLLNSLKNK